MKRILAFILAGTMLAASLAACAGDGASKDTTAAPTTTAPGETAAPETTMSEQDRLLSELPTGDFKDKTFNVMTVDVHWGDIPFSATELTGETFNDALFKRNEMIMDKLGVEIVETRAANADISDMLANSAQTQDGEFQAAIIEMTHLAGALQNNYVEDATNYDALQFDMPWWNQEMIDRFNFGDKTTVLFGDFHIGWASAHYVTAFSKPLITDSGLEDPYVLMEKNEWTWDKAYEMMNQVARDVNGDGQYKTEDDIYGIGHYSNAPQSFILSAGPELSMLEFDNEGKPTFTVHQNEKYLTAWEKMIRYFCSDERLVSMPGINGYKKIDPSQDGYKTIFAEGRLLFYNDGIGTLRDQRESEHEYGLAPSPKYDASQKEYYTAIARNAPAMVIPLGNYDTEFMGITLENICAYSHYTVMPAFVETTLHYKYARDEQSIAVLNDILDSNAYEISFCYNWSSINGSMQLLVEKGIGNIAAQMTQLARVIQKQIDKTYDALTE